MEEKEKRRFLKHIQDKVHQAKNELQNVSPQDILRRYDHHFDHDNYPLKPYVTDFVLGSLLLQDFAAYEPEINRALGERKTFSFSFSGNSILFVTNNGHRIGKAFLRDIEKYYLKVDETFSISLFRAYVIRLTDEFSDEKEK